MMEVWISLFKAPAISKSDAAKIADIVVSKEMSAFDKIIIKPMF